MRLNFWQWIGVALLVLCVALWIYEKNKSTGGPQPASKPAGQY